MGPMFFCPRSPGWHITDVSFCDREWSIRSCELELDTNHLGFPSSIALFIVATVPDHFLEDHLWNHVVKAHLPKVFMWTFAALLLMHILVNNLHLEGWMQENQLVVLLLACLVGLIPESGPHLLFLTLFVEGAIPFSIFLASSVVQDGHGMLPLLAESRWDFGKVKTINFVVGLLSGLVGYLSGW